MTERCKRKMALLLISVTHSLSNGKLGEGNIFLQKTQGGKHTRREREEGKKLLTRARNCGNREKRDGYSSSLHLKEEMDLAIVGDVIITETVKERVLAAGVLNQGRTRMRSRILLYICAEEKPGRGNGN